MGVSEVKHVERFLASLENVRRSRVGYIASCPVHSYKNANLSVKIGADGQVLPSCIAGCSVEHIVSSIGLKMSDLLSQDGDGKGDSPINFKTNATVQPKMQVVDITEQKSINSVADPNATERNCATDAIDPTPKTSALTEPQSGKDQENSQQQSGATLASAIEEKKKEREKQEAWEKCKNIAQKRNILEQVYKELNRCGLVGEKRAALLLYLVLVSRVLKRPLAAVVKGQSAAGKSHVVEKVLETFPESAYYDLESMSDKYIAYCEESFIHRILVLNEACGIGSDTANYYVRAILTKGRIRHGTVDTTGGSPKGRLVEKEGPTGLIVTTTEIQLHPENETRMLSIPVDDSPEQTKRIFKAAVKDYDENIDMTGLHALQTWLETEEHRVTIFFGDALAELVPAVEVRQRRDFTFLLNFIKAHAILHQETRGRDPQGRIIATLEDYAAVRELVADLMSEEVDESVPPVIRETVEAVRVLRSSLTNKLVRAKDVEEYLKKVRGVKLNKSSIKRRIDRAIKKGYLRNTALPRSRTLSLVLGDPMPGDGEVLPTVDELKACMVAEGLHAPESSVQPNKNEQYQPLNKAGCTVARKSEGVGAFRGDPMKEVKHGEKVTVFGPEGKKVYGLNQLKQAAEEVLKNNLKK